MNIRTAIRTAHAIGQRQAIDALSAEFGRTLAARALPALVTKADAGRRASAASAPSRPEPDPHAALLLAQLDHLLRCVSSGRDYRAGDARLHALWDDPHAFARLLQSALGGSPAHVRKAVASAVFTKAAEKAPKGGVTLTNHETGETNFYPGGRWIPAQAIAAAKPEERAALEQKKTQAPAPGAKKPAEPAAPTREVSRRHVADIARDVMLNPAARTPDKYRDLADAVTRGYESGHLSVTDLRALRLRLSAAFGDAAAQPHGAEKRTVAALVAYAESAARELAAAGKSAPTATGEPPHPDEPTPADFAAATRSAPAPTPGAAPEPGTFAVVPLSDLSIDPARFQFKIKVNESGVTKELDEVKQFNPDFAGVISVWRDPADGKTYVVNGHHRFELARRTGYPHLAVRFLEARDAREARAKGALINIAEGRGTALDAAKFLRDSGRSVADLAAAGVSPDGALVRDASTLTKLNDAAFDRVAAGRLDQSTAIAVAKHLSDHDRQEKLFKIIAKREDAGKEFTNRHLEEMARQMAAVLSAVSSSDGDILWDDTPSEEDTFLERSELASHVRGELAKEHHDYGALSSERRAGVTAEAGNVLNTAENRKRAAEADVHKHTFDVQAYRRGAVSDALDAGAVALKQAKTKKEKEDVRKQTLAAVRTGVADAAAGRNLPADGADGGGMEGVVPGGAAGGGTEPAPPESGGAGPPAAVAGGGGAGEAGVEPPAALPPRARHLAEQWEDKSKPLADRLDALGGLDTGLLDPLYNAGVLEGVPRNNEYFRSLHNALRRWQEGDQKSPMARADVRHAVESLERDGAQAVARIRDAAGRGVAVKNQIGQPVDYDLNGVADAYARLVPEAVAEVRRELDRPAPAKAAAEPDSPYMEAADAAGRLGISESEFAARLKHSPAYRDLSQMRDGSRKLFKRGQIESLAGAAPEPSSPNESAETPLTVEQAAGQMAEKGPESPPAAEKPPEEGPLGKESAAAPEPSSPNEPAETPLTVAEAAEQIADHGPEAEPLGKKDRGSRPRGGRLSAGRTPPATLPHGKKHRPNPHEKEAQSYASHMAQEIVTNPDSSKAEKRAAVHAAAIGHDIASATAGAGTKLAADYVSSLNDIAAGDSRFVAGQRVRRLADGRFQAEVRGKYVTDDADGMAERLSADVDRQAEQDTHDAVSGAIARAAAYSDPDPFSDPGAAAADAEARGKVPEGTPAVSLDEQTHGRVGTVHHDRDTGATHLAFGGEETRGKDFEPLHPQHSWRLTPEDRAKHKPKGGATGSLFDEEPQPAGDAMDQPAPGQGEPHERTQDEYVASQLAAHPDVKHAVANTPENAWALRDSLSPLMKSDHELAVANAVDAGKPIPAKVLADYPRQAERLAERQAKGETEPGAAEPEESEPLPSAVPVKHIDKKRSGIRINATNERGNEYFVTFADDKYGQTVAARDGKHARYLAATQRAADERAEAATAAAPEPSPPNAPIETPLSVAEVAANPAAVTAESPEPEKTEAAKAPAVEPALSPNEPESDAEKSHQKVTPEVTAKVSAKPPHVALADTLTDRLKAGALEKNELWKHADKHFGGTRAEGKYGPSEAYDSLEAGLNNSFAGQTDPTADLPHAQEQARAMQTIVDSLPTQTNRSGNKESFQQFSTPPHYAFAANWVANLKPTDSVLEPSAGTGNIAVHAKNSGAEVHVNELDPRRADFLRDTFGADHVHVENAEHISGILPKRGVKPSVVVMNPPFSQTAGRMGDKKEIMTGARHIEEAGRTLAPGGRLVAIVGGGNGDTSFGMSPDAPAYREWFAGMAKKGFTLRANVGVAGDEYKKYGTNFGTRMLVFDKTPPAPENQPVTGDAADIPDLMAKLEGVRNDRPDVAAEPPGEHVRGGVPGEAEGGTGLADDAAVPTGAGVAEPGEAGQPAVAGVPAGTEGAGATADGGRPGVDVQPAGERVRGTRTGRGKSAAGTGAVEGAAGTPGPAAAATEGAADRGGRGEAAGGKSVPQPAPVLPGVRPPQRIPVEPIHAKESVAERAGASGESLYESYRPQRMKVAGAVPHTTKLVESAAMAAVAPPVPTYQPTLSPDVIENAVRDVKNPDGTTTRKPIGISEAGLESIVYAGQAHNSFLQAAEGEAPQRRGYFIGDGTGAGKGRQIAGVMLDNVNQGKPKHVWVTEKDKLFNDAKRDWADMGQDPADLVHWDQLQKGGFKHPKGVAFVTYSTLRSGPKDQTKPRNVDQLINWLGKDFDGVVALDESHNLGNADDTPGPRGTVKASQQAIAAMKLQKALPNAKVLYVSATGATKPENLAYGDRLGLWGRGTSFADKADFLEQMHNGGTSAMEAVAQSMKARGLYNARSLSYDGVKTDRLAHHLSDEQKYVYDNLAEGWQNVYQNINAALEHIAGGEDKVKNAGQAKAAAMSQFQGAQQRFFNQIITSMMAPTVLKHMEQDLKEGRAPVVQLVNTMEAATKRALSSHDEDEPLEELDISPKQMLVDFLKNSFPVHRLEERTEKTADGGDRTVMVVAKDSHGNPIEDPQAVALRDELITRANDLKIPQSPLDQIVNHFGHESVAEATGRTVRLVRKPDDDGVVRLALEKRNPKLSNEAEARAFQGGKKKVLIFSEAGGTGASYHADKSAKNQAQRSHYLLQPGWRADKAVQGLGRTHRTNQASAPIFHLLEAPDVPGQKRFVSTIAKRLGQLGALTRGQAKTGGGVELFNAADNLESKEAQDGLEALVNSLKAGESVNGMSYPELMGKLGFKVEEDAGGGGGRRVRGQSDVPEMRQFLNRVLALKLADQQALFARLDESIQSKTEQARAAGTLDQGVEKFDADKVARQGDDETVYRDPDTGAEAKLVRTVATRKTLRRTFDEAKKYKPVKYVRNARSGRVWAVYGAAPVTEARTGNIIAMYSLKGPGGQPQHVQQAQIDSHYNTNYEPMEEPDAQKAWDEEYHALPETVESPEHFVTGDLLSVWDKLPQDKPKIYSVKLSDGTNVVGRHVPNHAIDDTLKRLGAAQKKGAVDHAPEDVHARVLGGETATLANGWRVKRSLVGGERRLELDGPIGMHKRTLTEDGVKVEKIASKERFFIPAGADGAKVLAKVIRSRNAPVTEVK